jgi:DNA repair exonuclease SbcCD ATPase subunit
MSDKNALDQKLKEWQEKYSDLKSQSGKVSHQNEIEFSRQLDLLDAKIDLIRQRLAKLQTATDSDRETIKASIDGISNEIENAIDSAWAKLDG